MAPIGLVTPALFEIPKMLNPDDKIDCELAELCFGVAADILDRDLDAEPDLFKFAIATISNWSVNVSENLDFDLFFADIIRRVGQSDTEREVEFIGDFVTEMFRSPMVMRSNSRKVSQFNILCAAAVKMECKKDDEIEPTLLDLLVRGDYYLFIEVDEVAFRKTITSAFKIAVSRPGFSLEELAKAIRQAQADADIRQLRAKMRLGRRRRSLPPSCGNKPAEPDEDGDLEALERAIGATPGLARTMWDSVR
jgi:hypothetical protein